ncbi:hypothetical protein MTR_0058s0140 [Medicago truncatula]|uniref:Uncharacterized protein n=1 Tax=Medicago truncatula TaxID=3880 RepID=A0A072TID9_MEDTR|nr:hypothetical protein MTR_0058s0140 [Medicago truncatula]
MGKTLTHYGYYRLTGLTLGPTIFVRKFHLSVVSRVNLFQDCSWLVTALHPKRPRWVKGKSKGLQLHGTLILKVITPTQLLETTEYYLHEPSTEQGYITCTQCVRLILVWHWDYTPSYLIVSLKFGYMTYLTTHIKILVSVDSQFLFTNEL